VLDRIQRIIDRKRCVRFGKCGADNSTCILQIESPVKIFVYDKNETFYYLQEGVRKTTEKTEGAMKKATLCALRALCG